MPVYKNKNNDSWFIKTYIKDAEGNSKQITKRNKEWIGKEGKIKAHQEEIRMINDTQNKISYEDLKITVEELCDEYLVYIKKMVRESSYTEYSNSIRKYVLPYFKNKLVRNLKNSEILAWHTALEDCRIGKSNQRPLSFLTKQKIHSTFSSVLEYGCMYKNLERNVAKVVGGFKKNKIEKDKNEEMTIITAEQFKKFLENENNEEYKLFFTVLFWTGMRKGELFALNVEDIDFTNRTIKITKSLRMRKNSTCERTKTVSSTRKIQMTDVVYNALLPFKGFKGRIFDESMITGETLRRKCKCNYKQVNPDKNFRIHDFRHSFASMCIDRGVPVEVISKYLGHKNISTTLDIYSHLYPNAQNKLIEKLNFS